MKIVTKKVGVIIGFFVFVNAAIGGLLYETYKEAIKTAHQSLGKKSNFYQQLLQKKQDEKSLTVIKDEIKAKIQLQLQQPQKNNALEIVYLKLLKAGFEISSLKQDETESRLSKICFEVVGGYQQWLIFLKEIQKTAQPLKITNLHLKLANDATLSGQLIISGEIYVD